MGSHPPRVPCIPRSMKWNPPNMFGFSGPVLWRSNIVRSLAERMGIVTRCFSGVRALASGLHARSAPMPQIETPEQNAMSLEDHLARLVAFESTTLPVISLYLNTQPDNHGRDHFEQFIRKEFTARAGTFPPG